MKKRWVLSVILAVFFFQACAFSQEHTWRATLAMVKTQWVAGEPIIAVWRMENVATRPAEKPYGEYFLDNLSKACVDRSMPSPMTPPSGNQTGHGTPRLEPPGAVMTAEVNMSRWCNLDAKQPGTIGHHKLRYRLTYRDGSHDETSIEFDIVLPTGVDKQIYDEFPDRFRDVQCDHSYLKDKSFIEKYPNSLYTAYFLVQGDLGITKETAEHHYGQANDPRFQRGRAKLDEKGNPIPDGKGGILHTSRCDIESAFIKQAESILQLHPDFAYRDYLNYRIALSYIAMLQCDGAVRYLETVQKDALSDDYRNAAKAHLDFLKQKGLIKG